MNQALLLLFVMTAAAEEYRSPDGAFTLQIPQGWRARNSTVNGQSMTTLEPTSEPTSGAQARILVAAGVAQARSIQELSQQAAQISASLLPGLTWDGQPKLQTQRAEQSYRHPRFSVWNAMRLEGEFYFAVLAIAAPETLARTLFEGATFKAVPRNTNLERLLIGRWQNSDNRTNRSGVRDKSMYMSNWSVAFAPNLRFESLKESFFDTQSDVYGGGNVGASDRRSGSYRIFGSTLIADFDGGARQLFTIELYPNGQGLKLNGNLFLRQ
jgi:hypothetical protein